MEIEIFVHFTIEEKRILRQAAHLVHNFNTTDEEKYICFLLLSEPHIPHTLLIKSRDLIVKLKSLADEKHHVAMDEASHLVEHSISEMERMKSV